MFQQEAIRKVCVLARAEESKVRPRQHRPRSHQELGGLQGWGPWKQPNHVAGCRPQTCELGDAEDYKQNGHAAALPEDGHTALCRKSWLQQKTNICGPSQDAVPAIPRGPKKTTRNKINTHFGSLDHFPFTFFFLCFSFNSWPSLSF